MSPDQKNEYISGMIQELNLEKHENSLSGTLSGGNKRKLSAAMSFLGNPSVVLLD